MLLSGINAASENNNSCTVQPAKVNHRIHHVSDRAPHNIMQQTLPLVTLTHNSTTIIK